MRILLTGLGLTLVVTGVLFLGLGRSAVVPGLVMGLAATTIELMAARWLVRGLRATTREALQGFVAGMLFRLLGIGLFAGLVVWNRELFPPLATGLGYVAVLIPLLFLEARLLR